MVLEDREILDVVHALAEEGRDVPLLVATVYEHGELVAFALGWPQQTERGEVVAYVRDVVVRGGHRGSLTRLHTLLARWDAMCRRLGIRQMVTPVERARPDVLRAGVRLAGYRPYAEDGEYVWCYRDIPAEEAA
jgi:hypothetical protein